MTIHNVLVRQELPSDFSSVFSIHEQAFARTFEADLVNRLRRSKAFVPELSLVALKDKVLAGHILFTKIKIKNKDVEHLSLAMAPVSVLPDFQNKGIGMALIRRGLDKATELGFTSVIVLGHEHYYPKFGFSPAEKWNIHCPFDVPSSFFMALELQPGSLNDISGMVEYAPEFAEA